ncbi:MAG: sigma-54 dependent transcriptional regulator, partial [Angelakisella sp.]
VLLDLKIGDRDGIEVLHEIKEIDSRIAVIMMTAYGSIKSSVKAMRGGAFTYLAKPLDLEELFIFIRQALEFRHMNERVTYLSDELKSRYQYGEMIGKGPAMQQVYNMIEKVKDIDTGVTIFGESGTGKELVARAIHFLGNRKEEKFIEVNCAAIPEGLLEEEFFGHKRGSFTGAVGDTKGKFEAADSGTIFLDEVGDMPLSIQGKLLRVLQQKQFSPIGSNEVKNVDVRVIVATNRNLREMVQDGTFRQDLFYRLNVVEINLPPLRERTQDIPLLLKHFIDKYNKAQEKNITGITKAAERLLLSYTYPGNIRELANALEYAFILSDGNVIDACDLPLQMQQPHPLFAAERSDAEDSKAREALLAGLTLREVERLAIKVNLEQNGGHKKHTAEQLGISERGLRNKLLEYALSD